MKKIKILLTLVLGVLTLASCSDWLEQEDRNSMAEKEAYSSDIGINSLVSNFYSRINYPQNFATDGDSYDLTSWDEATNNSQYWAFAGNKGSDYRNSYDYTLIREINMHISILTENPGGIPTEKMKYYIAEARYMRAYMYFSLVSRLGGVPLLTEAQEYTDNPASLAKPRNKESEIYDFIADEVDAIKNDLDVKAGVVSNTRASKGSALALKCRAMLYAGSLAYNFDKSQSLGLNKASGVTGIDKSKANDYLKKCIDAAIEIKQMNRYDLYRKDADLGTNFSQLFIKSKSEENPEIIFAKAYDGKKIKNTFTTRALARSLTAVGEKSGAQINPVLNLAQAYEEISTRKVKEFDAYVGAEKLEVIETTTSNLQYVVYDKPQDIFAGRDNRLSGTILLPGSSFRDKPIDLQAGLAILESDGSYSFNSVPTTLDIAKPTVNQYNGVKINGADGPFRAGDDCWYISHSGFLLRKYVDTQSGSEIDGASQVSYIIFRYGEVLLNAGEAAYLLSQNGVASYAGKSTQTMALGYINEVRNRAAGSAFEITPAELDYPRIMNERRVELAYEDHRYYDLKRWRTADQLWAFDRQSTTAVMFGLWPYKIYAPGNAKDGKWIYRKVTLENRGSSGDKSLPLNFSKSMYYTAYPMDKGNSLIEPNPYQ